MSKKHEGQALLMYSTDGDGAFVLETIGAFAEQTVDECGREVFGLPGWTWTEEWVKHRKSFTVWEGTITESGKYDSYQWHGAFRPAIAADFPRFGLKGLEP